MSGSSTARGRIDANTRPLVISGVVLFALMLTFLAGTGRVYATHDGTPGGECGPMDVAFVIDDTGSMGGALANITAGLASIMTDIEHASGNDYQLSVVAFKDNITIHETFAANNAATASAALAGLFASGGAGAAEASDESLNTVVNALAAAGRPQNIDFAPAYRAGALKIAILVTDAPPGGFDDTYTVGVDDVNANQVALDAASQGILISAIFVPTGGDYAGQAAIMMGYATTTGGVYTQTAADGSGVNTAIQAIIAACGSSSIVDDVDKWWNHTNVCFDVDNDGDGRLNEDPEDYELVPADTNGDGVIDPGEGDLVPVDNDGDGLFNEDGVECERGTTLGDVLVDGEADAVVAKNGTVKNYNPGQVYAVTQIVVNGSGTLSFDEDWSDCLDLLASSPANGGGRLVVVRDNGGVLEQILDAKDIEALGGTVGPDGASFSLDVSAGTYYVLAKFAPVTGWDAADIPASCTNTSTVDGAFSASADFAVVEK